MSGLDAVRAQKGYGFATHPENLLTSEQRQEFKRLSYFPTNPDLRLEVTVDRRPGFATCAAYCSHPSAYVNFPVDIIANLLIESVAVSSHFLYIR